MGLNGTNLRGLIAKSNPQTYIQQELTVPPPAPRELRETGVPTLRYQVTKMESCGRRIK